MTSARMPSSMSPMEPCRRSTALNARAQGHNGTTSIVPNIVHMMYT